jgi:hypothetical protein
MLFFAVRARSRSRRHPRRGWRPALPSVGLLGILPTLGLRTNPTGAASRWWHRLGDPTTRTLPSMRSHPRVHPSPGRSRDAPTASRPSGRPLAAAAQGLGHRKVAEQVGVPATNGQRLAASSTGQQRHHRESSQNLPVRPGALQARSSSKVRHAACLHGPHGRRCSMRVEATLRHNPTGARLDRHPSADRVVHHRRLAADRERAPLKAVVETRLTPIPVCFVAPENPPTTVPMRTHTPNPSSP